MAWGPYWNQLPQTSGKSYVDQASWNQVIDNSPNWKGDVNGGGYKLSNVILSGSGSFQYQPSPTTITQGADGKTIVAYTMPATPSTNPPLNRWTAGKDATAETGSNSGSNYAITRYNDAGVAIDSPIQINRATGVVTLAAQTWAGNVSGGGMTLSNIVLGASVTLPTHTHDASAIISGIIAVARLGSGTPSNSVFLRGDGAWAALPPSGGKTYVNSALIGTEPGINVVAGTNVIVSGADDSVNGWVKVTVNATGTGGGQPQTPWAQDIQGAGFQLLNAGNIGIGTSTAPITAATAGRAYLTVKGSTEAGVVELATGLGDTDGSLVGLLTGTDPMNSQTDKRIGYISYLRSGATAANRGGVITFSTRADNTANAVERMRLTNAGNVGIGTTNPTAYLHINGSGASFASINLDNAHSTSGDTQYVDFSNGAVQDFARVAGTAVSTTAGYLSFWTKTGGAIAERMRIDSAGNVGIGTATTWAPLTLSTGYAAPSLTHQSAACAAITINGGTELAFFMNTSAGFPVSLQTRHNASDGFSYPLCLNPLGGNVGIGTSSPSATLHVIGTAKFGTSAAAGAVGDIAISRDGNPTIGALFFGSGGQYIIGGPTGWTFSPALTGVGGPTTQNVVTGSRANNTVYQNTTGRPMFVTVAEVYTGANNFSAYSDSSSNPTTVVAWSAVAANGAQAGVSFWVLPNNYYKVATAGHTLAGWTEWY